ncbi:MAG: hypothetical protein KGZ69_12595 [Methylomonas sp.]|nr:hypothetical protein [Methylomonas sp.]
MTTELEALLAKMKSLENELIEELQKQEKIFSYEIRKRKVYFEENAIIRDKEYIKTLYLYLRDAPIKHIVSAPFIWSCLIPALLLDAFCSLYQWTCFPIYGIPKVQRQDYIAFDREYLNYLNFIEKINCAYCSYMNGLFAYLQETAGRTEQFWCPIKHARRIKNLHSRYYKFFNYGNAAEYRSKVAMIRRDFSDLE